MATYSTNEFKNGLKLIIDGDPCSIVENEVVSRVKVKHLTVYDQKSKDRQNMGKNLQVW